MEQIDAHRCFGGRQLRFQHASESLSCSMRFSLFLPPQAEEKAVPALYWLSGLTCTDENFLTKAGAQQFAARHGIALIAPDTSPRGESVPDDPEGAYDLGLGAGFYLNATQEPWRRHYRMYDYVVDELPRLVNENFAIDAARSGISGHSMGGHGALTIALKNPSRYLAVSAFAPICSPPRCPWGRKALQTYLGDDRDLWAEHDTTVLLGAASERLPMLVDQGDADPFLTEQLQTQLLAEAGEHSDYPITIRMQAGYDHSYYFIASFIESHIAFHAGYLLES